MDDIFYWLGVATASVGSVGVICLLLTWAIDVALRKLGFAKMLIQAYGRILQDKNAAKFNGA